MKLYFAWAENNSYQDVLNKMNVKRRLWSFYKLWKWIGRRYDWDFFLDSWAFSAYSVWAKIDIDEYIVYIKKYNIKQYACLDVIWDAEWTLKNQKYMESKWLNPIPTFHLWEDVSDFKKLLDYPYIWLWWMVPYAKQPEKIRKFLDYCFNYILKNKLKVKCHGRWMTNPKFMIRYPFYSVDSTGRLAASKFSSIPFFKNGKRIGIDAQNYRKQYGIDFCKLHYLDKTELSIKAYLQLEDYVTKLHQAKGMEYRL